MLKTNRLARLGWNDFFRRQLAREAELSQVGRVVRQDLAGYQLEAETGRFSATLPGRMHFRADSRAELPAVGDWVLFEALETTGDAEEIRQGVITRVLERRTRLLRADAEDREQVVAANMETIFILCGMDQSFNPGRIERFLLSARGSGATPVILLSKADLCPDAETQARQKAVQSLALDIKVLPSSVFRPETVRRLAARYLPAGHTLALLGASGVGKSTLINALLGEERMPTGAVRRGTGQGRHTTTHRELLLAPGDGLVMDTPGMSDLQPGDDEASLEQSFRDLEEWAAGCRFADCTHRREPGCAVRKAEEDGALSRERVASYLRLQEEMRTEQARQEEKSWRNEKRRRPGGRRGRPPLDEADEEEDEAD